MDAAGVVDTVAGADGLVIVEHGMADVPVGITMFPLDEATGEIFWCHKDAAKIHFFVRDRPNLPVCFAWEAFV